MWKKSMILIMMLVILVSLKSRAADNQPELYKLHTTAYCLPGTTCTGIAVRDGICASGRPDWIGKTVILYQRLPSGGIGDIIGIYEVQDSGCSKNVIDVWCQDLDACQEYMNKVYEDGCKGKVYVQVIDAEG